MNNRGPNAPISEEPREASMIDPWKRSLPKVCIPQCFEVVDRGIDIVGVAPSVHMIAISIIKFGLAGRNGDFVKGGFGIRMAVKVFVMGV